MRPSAAFGLLLAVLLPSTALAQPTFEGLDLSGESTEAKQPEEEVKPPPPSQPDPEPYSPPAASSEAPLPKLSEMEIASEDRVKSVQRKPFIRKGRFDLTPLAFLTVNDAFFPKFGPGGRATYHLQDNLGLGVRFFQYNLIPSDNVRLAKRQLQSRLPSVLPKTSLALDFMWAPIYGKVSLFNTIQHFDLYLVGGVGAMWSQTSDVDGPHLTTHIGIGQRFSLNSFLGVDLSLVETLYTDRPGGGQKGVTQHVLSVNGGVSIYLPPSFEYKEP